MIVICGDEIKEKSFYYLIAKSGKENQWLPVWAHSLDVAGVMEKLYIEWLPDHIRLILEENGRDGPPLSSEEMRKLCLFIGLMHDFGKLTPIFQYRISSAVDSEVKNRLEHITVKLPEHIANAGETPHALASEAMLLVRGCPKSVSVIVGGHHGIPSEGAKSTRKKIDIFPKNFFDGNEAWQKIYDDWFEFALKLSGYEQINEVPELDITSQMILTGLLIMADWIASNSQYAPLIDAQEIGTELQYPKRIEEIWEAVDLPNQWRPSCLFMDDELFIERYGFTPNTMQRAVIEAVENADEPGIYIIEAPMGQGKTEAALAASEILATKGGYEGVFFGLPTQATANGIFPRLKAWGEKQALEGGESISIKLAHGLAMMQEDYFSLFRGNAVQEEDKDANIKVHPWFEGRKQSLLASFVVGTVDQLLMAALNQKHVMLRHLGLAGKVVVIDEVHAYDAYMSTYLERALSWLGAYKVPVILLSATLPAAKRVSLIKAYAGQLDESEAPANWQTSEAYPLLTYTDQGAVKQVAMEVPIQKKKVQLKAMSAESLSQTLESLLQEGGCAGVIVNTVGQAQTLAKQLEETLPSSFTIMLLHARFTAADRQKKEKEILERIGKRSTEAERHQLVVVGTQILEQSLDIDFDVLFTQLSPMDLLLQRLGRLHRHGFRQRPMRVQEPICYLMDCPSSLEDELDKGSESIYGAWLLRQTADALSDEIVLPDDISPLVQEVYADPILARDEATMQALWEEYHSEQLQKERKAQAHRLSAASLIEETIHGLLEHRAIDSDSASLARVRDGESSIQVLLMVAYEEDKIGFLPSVGIQERLSYSHVPEEAMCRKILEQRVQLPRKLGVYKFNECLTALEQQNASLLSEWQRSRWLNGELILLLEKEDGSDTRFQTTLCGERLIYDNRFGLLNEKEVSYG